MDASLESDGCISVYEIETGNIVAQYEGLDVHRELVKLRAEVSRLETQIIHYEVGQDEMQAENDRLRAALEKYANPDYWHWDDFGNKNVFALAYGSGFDIARKALTDGEK